MQNFLDHYSGSELKQIVWIIHRLNACFFRCIVFVHRKYERRLPQSIYGTCTQTGKIVYELWARAYPSERYLLALATVCRHHTIRKWKWPTNGSVTCILCQNQKCTLRRVWNRVRMYVILNCGGGGGGDDDYVAPMCWSFQRASRRLSIVFIRFYFLLLLSSACKTQPRRREHDLFVVVFQHDSVDFCSFIRFCCCCCDVGISIRRIWHLYCVYYIRFFAYVWAYERFFPSSFSSTHSPPYISFSPFLDFYFFFAFAFVLFCASRSYRTRNFGSLVFIYISILLLL